jgi:hypothetical protein
MSREIRRVPPSWQHPKDGDGNYIPLHDESYAAAASTWVHDCIAWATGTHPDLIQSPELKTSYPFYWEWADYPPDAEQYRPHWLPDEASAYQVYENVTEGTPVSPVFTTRESLDQWLQDHGLLFLHK